jgi:hypothetical protein
VSVIDELEAMVRTGQDAHHFRRLPEQVREIQVVDHPAPFLLAQSRIRASYNRRP